MKAFVTGGSGFLGRHIVKELLKNGCKTVLYDRVRSPYLDTGEYDSPLLTEVQGNILDLPAVRKAMKGCDVVFHTAALADLDTTRMKPLETMETNVMGTARCLDAARENRVKRFLFASTVYTSGHHGSFYRVSKQAGESLCRTYHDEFGLPYTILRYGSLYGREPNHWNFIYSVCKALLTTREFHYASPGNAVREYIHINDAARETVRIATDPRLANKAVLITGHQRMTVKEFFDMVQEILGYPVKITYTPREKTRHYVMTPYSLEMEVPVRVNLPSYVDINEGILDCLRDAQRELDPGQGTGKGRGPGKGKAGTSRKKR
ncbi:MAG TPA: NAD(P)-dependent oxidoreductase [Methanomicrobiales archaeon]|nr:NAD(P)-dependent oxidoreductase [Methanomicrobiales archaeon]